ncbi:ElyC/SanA/YdcF family protein [Streptomyces sp. 549]|uniref:SanA/YdcF family protein n=1 Tax=Streptomyces sp. 549 TaxID=3049076 RepID=UPI0024C45763|nr:ElyC/SanA/YdcF family protein [Streptomyces sp. 549]MDK1474297.1 ElyC/SanA/YdcF family protein [Streptomyces sp. 549]
MKSEPTGALAHGIPTRRKRQAVQITVLLCVLALLPAVWIKVSTEDRISSAADAPSAPVAVVFGAGLWGDRPTPYLAHRLDAAAELYRRGAVRALLVTGDNSRQDYDEPSAMRRYLEDSGVPADRIVADYAGFDTWNSCVRARRIFGVERALLVSQGYHVPRTVALCEAAGLDVHGVAVDEPRDAVWYHGTLRELAAAGKAGLNATFRPDPRFLGPEEPGVARALDR